MPDHVSGPRWMLLIHQIPPKPAYFRAKVGRRLARLGAVAVKNSVYILPLTDQAQEDLQWLAREIVAEGGEATLCTATFVEGLRDDQIEALFHAARDADYAQLGEQVRQIVSELPPRLARDDERRHELEAELARLRERLAEIGAIDFFSSSGRQSAESALETLDRRLRRGRAEPAQRQEPRPRREEYRGRTWVTRKNVHIDRIASAWLIRRFIDPEARFAFVPGQGYRSQNGEVTFDMADGVFTHVGDACTFETLLEQFDIREAGLATLAEIIHDIDVKDAKFGRPEGPGVAALIAGIALAERDDEARIELGGRMFEALLELYRRKRGGAERSESR